MRVKITLLQTIYAHLDALALSNDYISGLNYRITDLFGLFRNVTPAGFSNTFCACDHFWLLLKKKKILNCFVVLFFSFKSLSFLYFFIHVVVVVDFSLTFFVSFSACFTRVSAIADYQDYHCITACVSDSIGITTM